MRANFIAQILGDSTAHRNALPAWSIQNVLPVTGTGAEATINYIASALSVRSINQNAYASLINYMNTQREWDDTFSNTPYNSTLLEHQK